MSKTQFDLRQVIHKLKATLGNTIFIGDSIDFANAKEANNYKTPSLYVALEKEITQQNSDDNNSISLNERTRQYLYCKFSVTLVTTNNRYSSSPSSTDLELIIGQVRDALIGWAPDLITARKCQFESGEMLSYNTSFKIWQENYVVRYAMGTN